MFGPLLLGASGNPAVRSAMTRSAPSRSVVARSVTGEDVDAAPAAVCSQTAAGLGVGYDDTRWDDMQRTVEHGSPCGLTGAMLATDRTAIAQATDVLRFAAWQLLTLPAHGLTLAPTRSTR